MTTDAGPLAAVLAVDGGNSKTDVLLVAHDGRVLAEARGATISHQAVPLSTGMARLRELVAGASRDAARALGVRPPHERAPVARIGSYCLAGADFPSDIRLLTNGLAMPPLAERDLVRNDTFGPLRAGAPNGWGVALICGEGINAAGVAPDGRTARFAGIGELSGDWGGGHGLGQEALAAAIRGRDGRAPRTALEAVVAAHFGMGTPEGVMRALYHGRIPERRLSELAPEVFRAAEAGDAVAAAIVDRLARELSSMAIALMRRLGMVRRETPVVLAGGVFATSSSRFHGGLAAAITAAAPRARLVRLAAPPVAGAALLGLDALAESGTASDVVVARLHASLELNSSATPAGTPRGP